nr:capsid protein [Sarcosphaera coronaria partitivirus]
MLNRAKKGTKSLFSFNKGKGVDTSVPLPPAPQPSNPLPSYKDQNEEIGERDKLDKTVEDANKRDEKANEKERKADATTIKPTAKENELNTKQGTSTSTPENVFSIFWDQNLLHNLVPYTYPKVARYVPNAMSLISLLDASIPVVGRMSYIQRHQPTFNPYAVKVGYCILYYLQILRAKGAASDIDGTEHSLLNRFFKMFPEEVIPIAEPLFPFFSSIHATQLSDNKYEWIVPDYNMPTDIRTIGGAHLNEFNQRGGLCYIQPQVPYMIALLADFGRKLPTELQARLSQAGVYTPVDFDRAAAADYIDMFGYAGNNRPRFRPTDPVTNVHKLFMSCGMNTSFQFYNQNVQDALIAMQESEFFGPKGVTFSATGTGTADVGVNLTQDKNISSIDSFLNLEKSRNPRWFEYILGQMMIFSSCFKNTFNLSQVGKTGGLESSIIVELRTIETAAGPPPTYRYADLSLGKAHANEVKYYENRFNELTAHAYTTRVIIDKNEMLQAITFATHSTPPVTGINPDFYRYGKFFQHFAEIGPRAQRIGMPELDIEGPIDMFLFKTLIPKMLNEKPQA